MAYPEPDFLPWDARRVPITFNGGYLGAGKTTAVNLADGHPAKPPPAHLDMVDDLRRFVAQLAARSDPTLQIRSVEIVDEFHATVPSVVLN